MRDLKFRAWDFQENKMISWDELTSGKHPYNYLSMLASTLGIVVFMQFTGLKDKNGKEIYVGDLLQGSGNRGKRTEMLAEIYETDFAINSRWKYFNPTEKDRKDFFSSGAIDRNLEEFEIIGNIYENPELLSKGKDKRNV